MTDIVRSNEFDQAAGSFEGNEIATLRGDVMAEFLAGIFGGGEEKKGSSDKQKPATIASLKGTQPANDQAPKLAFSHISPISAEIVEEEAAKEAAKLKAEEEEAKNPQIGQLVAGKGIFLEQ